MLTKTRNILLVDDEQIVRQTLQSFIKALGYEANGAPNATIAHQMLQESAFDLLILDLCLPGPMSSYDLMKWMKNNHPEIPIIVISGHGDEQAQAEIFKHGVKHFMPKPLSLVELDKTITYIQQTHPSFQP